MGVAKKNAPFRRITVVLREHIEIGLYAPWQRMPPVRDLAALHDVSATVVRRALKELRDEGIIAIRAGDGHYVIPPAGHDADDGTPHGLRRMTLVAVLRSDLSLEELAHRTDTTYRHIDRMLSGRVPLTPEWSQKIIDMANADLEEKKTQMTAPSRTPPAYQKIADALRSDIADDIYEPGQALPPLRDLADEYHVSAQPVRRAISELIAEGLLVTVYRDATYVTLPKNA